MPSICQASGLTQCKTLTISDSNFRFKQLNATDRDSSNNYAAVGIAGQGLCSRLYPASTTVMKDNDIAVYRLVFSPICYEESNSNDIEVGILSILVLADPAV